MTGLSSAADGAGLRRTGSSTFLVRDPSLVAVQGLHPGLGGDCRSEGRARGDGARWSWLLIVRVRPAPPTRRPAGPAARCLPVGDAVAGPSGRERRAPGPLESRPGHRPRTGSRPLPHNYRVGKRCRRRGLACPAGLTRDNGRRPIRRSPIPGHPFDPPPRATLQGPFSLPPVTRYAAVPAGGRSGVGQARSHRQPAQRSA